MSIMMFVSNKKEFCMWGLCKNKSVALAAKVNSTFFFYFDRKEN